MSQISVGPQIPNDPSSPMEVAPPIDPLVEKTQREMVQVLKSAGIKLHKVAGWAVKKRRRDILNLLITSVHNVDLDKPGSSGYTPLGLAVLAGDKQTVKILVDAGASVDYHDEFGNTPLKYASLTHHRAIGRILRRSIYPGEKEDDEPESDK